MHSKYNHAVSNTIEYWNREFEMRHQSDQIAVLAQATYGSSTRGEILF